MKLYQLKMPMQKEWTVEFDDPQLICSFELNYGKYIFACGQSISADIRIIKRDDLFYDVIVDETEIHTQEPLSAVERFIFENPSYASNIVALHGAAVEWEGKCYVFLAPTTTGKTTLTSYLTCCGCGYVTEDCVLLDRSSKVVYPFSMPLHLREGGLQILKQYGALPAQLRHHEHKIMERYIYTPTNCVEMALPLGEIFFIERTVSENAILNMNATEKMTALMKSPITEIPITPEYLRFLACLSKTYCKQLRYCDMNFVKEVILQYEPQSSV